MGVARLRERASRAVAWLEQLTSTRRGAVVLFALALLAYAIRAIAWPLTTGRDLDEYLLAYVQLFDHHVLLPWSMLFRTPVTPLFAGLSLDLFGGRLAEPAMAVLYAGSIVCWAAAARYFGARAALAVAAALLLYQGYALMFHELSSEPVFAAAFAVWGLLVVRASFGPTVGRFALVGLGVAVLALVRPGNAVLLAFGIVPLLVAGAWRARLQRTAAFAVAALLPLAAWSVHNGVRFDSWGLARGGNAIIPFYRAFITDHIISPENGEDSRRLAAAMQQHLLTREPYRSYGVTLDQLFRDGSFRVHEDLYLLSDQVFGWDSNYDDPPRSRSRGRARPSRDVRARRVADDLGRALEGAVPHRLVGLGGTAAAAARASDRRDPTGSAFRRRPRASRSRPARSSGSPDPIRASVRSGRHRPSGTSSSSTRRTARASSEITRETDRPLRSPPGPSGNARLALRLNQLSRWFPRPWMWIVLGLIAIALRRPRGWPILVALSLAAFAVVR